MKTIRILAILLSILLLAFTGATIYATNMPGKSAAPSEPEVLSDTAMSIQDDLQNVIETLATKIGPRNVARPEPLQEGADFIQKWLENLGFEVQKQTFQVNGVDCHNLWVDIEGTEEPDEILVIGAHYDTAGDSPGANDNGSGIAATMALARKMGGIHQQRTLRLMFFVNEEPPHFQTENMGSLVYARQAREDNENIIGMISLETIGYFTDEPGSQKYPVAALGAFYPSEGNFLAFVGNFASRKLLRKTLRSFREHSVIPSEGVSLPDIIPGVGWSDHWAFWQADYPAIMITDTAPFRYPYYHTPEDTADKVDYARMALAVEALIPVIKVLTND